MSDHRAVRVLRAGRLPIVIGASVVMLVVNGWLRAQTPPRLLGFSSVSSAAELDREKQFGTLLSAKANEADFDVMTAEPHHVGSPYEIRLADYVADQMKAAGLETTKYEYGVLVPWPGERMIEVVAPDRVKLDVDEETLRGDRWAAMPGILPAYNAYSPSGDVTADVVYVNFGVPADYDTLAKIGVDVKGKIVIARYGGSWRGIKPKVAAEHGAVGCIIYSDPHEDGYFKGDVYPRGPWRSQDGAQRGSVADISLYAGDPLTPSIGATRDAKRLPTKEAPSLTKIPVLPISYADALPILRNLGGPMAPQAWRGALPISYHLGPGPAIAHLKLEFDWKLVPAYDVIARLEGTERPDQWIIRGNHHDAWVFGASDPVSGTVALLEEARAVGELSKNGFKPRRTIIYAAWDGEEPGLLGSTEWVETHAEVLAR